MPLALGLALLSTVPVAWRAHFPLLATVVVLAANGACVYAAAPQQAAFQPFVALVLVAYSVGSRAEGRRAMWVPPVLAAAAIPVFVAAIIHGQDPGNAILSFVWLMAACVVGRLQNVLRLLARPSQCRDRRAAGCRAVDGQVARRERARQAQPARPRAGSGAGIRERPRPAHRSSIAGPMVPDDPDGPVQRRTPHLRATRGGAGHLDMAAACGPSGLAFARVPADRDGPRLPLVMQPTLGGDAGPYGRLPRWHANIQTCDRARGEGRAGACSGITAWPGPCGRTDGRPQRHLLHRRDDG